MTIRVRQLRLQAFRAYPGSREFPFPNELAGSVLIFAPNGHGKSSVTDAFEFLLNPDATLERLGVRDAEMTSGRRPLRNTKSPPDLKALVELKITDSDDTLRTGVREANDTSVAIPAELGSFVRARVVDFIIRGPDLRNLIYKTTPRERYEELARYISAKRLADLQADIRSIELQLRRDSEGHERELTRLENELRTLTAAAVTRFDEPRTFAWLCDLLRPHDISLGSFEQTELVLSKLEELAANERSTLAQQQHQRQIARINAILATTASGTLTFLDPLSELHVAVAEHEAAARASAQASSHRTIEQAILLLLTPGEYPDSCPLCGTSYSSSPYGSRDGVIAHLREIQGQLGQLRAAEAKLSTAKRTWEQRIARLDVDIRQVADACNIHGANILAAWSTYSGQLSNASQGANGLLVSLLITCRDGAAALLASAPSYTPTFVPLVQKVKALHDLRHRHDVWTQIKARRDAVTGSVSNARSLIDREAHAYISSAVESVAQDIIAFYKAVQEFAVVPVAIRMGLMESSNIDSRGLELLVDFPEAPGAKPRAYLSDSQINTLGLGLRLALIRKFNPKLPFAVLDDVVTSYDADYRRQIAKVLLNQFADMQLIVLTHDEQFMREMRDRIVGDGPSRWRIRQIQRYSPDDGPVFVDAPTSESDIEQRLARGESAANPIRQYLERWLMRTGEGLGARVVIRRTPDYSHRELLDSLVEAAEARGFRDVLASDVTLRSLLGELQTNTILNQGSHGGDNQHRTGSVGDERSLWEDIKRFVTLFACPSCHKRRFKFDPLSRNVSCENCGHFLRFVVRTP